MRLQKASFVFRLLGAALFCVALPAEEGLSAEPEQRAPPAETKAAKLVPAALESELAGDNQRRDALLRQAVERRPNDAGARWQLGELRVRGTWQSPAEIEAAAQQDQRLAEYRRRRGAAKRTVADQAALAHWCGTNRLDDQARVHWLIVLQLQPDNAKAIAALKLQPCLGTLMTPAQIQRVKKQIRGVSKAADRWRGLVAQWCKRVARGDPALPAAVREKLVKVSDAAEMLGVEQAMWGQASDASAYRAMALAMMPALGENPYPAAAASLARHAVFADFDDVRAAAIAGLGHHPLDHYAMLLVGGLQMPLEGKVSRGVLHGRTGVECSVFQEGPVADLSLSYTLAVRPWLQFDDGGIVAMDDVAAINARVRSGFPLATILFAIDAVNFAAGTDEVASNFRSAVELANKAIPQRNARIADALRVLTDVDLGDEPMPWWKWWWQDYNEMYNVSSRARRQQSGDPPKPVYECRVWREYVFVVPCSCFAPGTKVWTQTGRQPIEQVNIGDLVLAQDVETGELTYKPVLAVTTRAPGPRMRSPRGFGHHHRNSGPSLLGRRTRLADDQATGSRLAIAHPLGLRAGRDHRKTAGRSVE